ncbi:prenyltransferase/squalene oxidase repeat-containing protein [Actinocorallia populi]|uniref:prenyltransferase/squalene oxidase repeat-containing protein n=1 Tax=Actinocorallia populi TaxID=2079200 RepID=UPI000D08930A|nr:prenyltransferase/squalene oxidase repeat-containing protein [Actinocorallia populi]
MLILDVRDLHRHLSIATETLRDHYRSVPDGPQGSGGWYHELGGAPGATATALALACFVDCDEAPDRLDQALRFLREHQQEDGGWPTRTSGSQAVVEATGWIAWALARIRCDLREGAPDLHRATRWLIGQQNPDGGWGSMRDAPSRVWLTCLALRALNELDPHADAVAHGVRWLLDQRVTDQTTRARVWGVNGGAGGPTVTHTAFALITLAELRPADLSRHLPAFAWLTRRLAMDPANPHKWIETYTVAPAEGGAWRLNLWHYGLPLALTALLHHPEGPPVAQVGPALERILRISPGEHIWGDDITPGESPSLWSLWWSLQAITSVYRQPLFRPDDLVVWLKDAVVIRRGTARRKPLFSLAPALWAAGLGRLLKRYWAYAALLLLCSLIGGGVLAGWWKGEVFWVGLVIPMALIPLQEAFKPRR